MEISFLIVSYNSCDVTLACVKHILSSVPPGTEFEIIVVDNNSSDETVAILTKEVPCVRIVVNPNNRGYGSAHNIGVAHANGEILFLLNSDFFINSFSVRAALDALRTEPDQIMGFQLLFQSGTPQRCVGVMPGLFDLIMDLTALKPLAYKISLKAGSGANTREVRRGFYLSGAGVAICAKMFVSIGGFDEIFFFFAEDSDLCFQASRKGLRQNVCIGDPCIHFGGYATKKVDSNYAFKSQNYVTSYLKFCQKNRSKVAYAAVRLLLPIKFTLYGFCFFLLSRKSNAAPEKYQFQFACLKQYFSRDRLQ